jgi:ParB-like chromosome segregation protein Spo0J
MAKEITEVKISELNPAPYNPRKWSEDAVRDLTESVKRFGMVDPILVNSAENRRNIVIGGHFRLKVAKDLGMETVPVVYVNIPDEAKEKELNLRLNKNLGDWDWELLKQFDEDMLKDVGFSEVDIEKNIFFEDYQDDEFEDYALGTINSWVRIGDLTGEIEAETYEKLKKIIEEKGGLQSFIKDITGNGE